uniref:Uncharacterized protein n=1 Tax=Anguilla anguilla TaxID=7936 RepID=A0A0E9XSJ4_ANGAN
MLNSCTISWENVTVGFLIQHMVATSCQLWSAYFNLGKTAILIVVGTDKKTDQSVKSIFPGGHGAGYQQDGALS